jgi:hypothetical protein
MLVTLSKEQLAHLDEDQLAAYARIHLDSGRSRRHLCDLASGRSRNHWVPAIAFVVGTIAVVWFPSILRDPFNLTFIVIALLFYFHTRTNRRIDALVSLLETDRITTKQEAEQGVTPQSATRGEFDFPA